MPPRNPKSRTGAPLIGERLFRSVLIRERKRADRSNQALALALLTLNGAEVDDAAPAWQAVVDALDAARRETDVIGWFENRKTIGLILPELPSSEPSLLQDFNERVRRELSRRMETPDIASMQLHVLPDPNAVEAEAVAAIAAPPNVKSRKRATYDGVKRALDIVLSLALLAVFSPLFLLIAALVKLTSAGPVFFRQERVGQMMKPFMMLKFRTMYVNNDHAIHHQFVSDFITSSDKGDAVKDRFFKIADDPRVTSIGRILRRTSLDELPQFWNVLVGEMSLVGPRPPLAYEVVQYKSWHRRRVMEAKPGLTGLWQVTGRSRTTFDEMVRLDLRYARTHSVWTDIKILLATPRAVFSGKGAC
jgi:lipopolysaccharide/colanic/teichoic acid biosynthesis glycosyltransferase